MCVYISIIITLLYIYIYIYIGKKSERDIVSLRLMKLFS